MPFMDPYKLNVQTSCGTYIYIYGFGAFSGPPRFGESAKVLLMSYSLS